MKNLSKRIDTLEQRSTTTDKEVREGLGEYYAWEKTPEGQASLAKFYGTEKEQKKIMDDYRKKLKERGLL